MCPHPNLASAVYRNPRRPSDAWLALQERRRRENEAPRLKLVVPRLVELKFKMFSMQGEHIVAGTEYMKLVPVLHASAHFEIPCSDPRCKDGGHDISYEILRALKGGEPELEGEDACRGVTGSAECRRSLRYSMTVTYET